MASMKMGYIISPRSCGVDSEAGPVSAAARSTETETVQAAKCLLSSILTKRGLAPVAYEMQEGQSSLNAQRNHALVWDSGNQPQPGAEVVGGEPKSQHIDNYTTMHSLLGKSRSIYVYLSLSLIVRILTFPA